MMYRQTTDQTKPGSSAFYKGVIEWILCEMARSRYLSDDITVIEFSDLLSQPEKVAQ